MLGVKTLSPFRRKQLIMAIQLLKESLEQLDEDGEQHRRLQFLIEQLRLTTKTKYSRVYSPQLLVMSYRLHAASAAAYNVLMNEHILCIPSTTTLKKVTRHLNGNNGLDNKSYLKLRISKLNQFDRNVLMMIDEIYIAKRVEYARGEIQGLTADGDVASTLLFHDQIHH